MSDKGSTPGQRLSLSLACQNSDRTRPLLDGRVCVEGVDVVWAPGDPEEIFHRAFRHQEFDVSEISLGTHLMLTARGESPYVGVPVFLSRVFRHSAIYVRGDRGIAAPGDLAGRRVGVPDYQQTAALWVRGMLAEEYGVKPSDILWHSGGLEQPGRGARTALALPPAIRLQSIPADATLSRMLAAGELDAVISPRQPSSFDGVTVKRLFPDYRAAEEAYFRKRGLFPIMHALGIRRPLAERHPWLAANLYKAFAQAKAVAMQELQQINFLRVSLPWLEDDLGRVRRVMGDDYWRYGLTENLPELAAMCRYAAADGMATREVDPAELFAASTADMFKI